MRGRRGFTLLEALATVALLGVALSLAASLSSRGPRASERLLSHRTALRAAEGALEAVRAGVIAPVSGPVTVLGGVRGGPAVRVRLVVRPVDTRGLLEVRATATAAAPGRPVTQTLSTLVWRKR